MVPAGVAEGVGAHLPHLMHVGAPSSGPHISPIQVPKPCLLPVLLIGLILSLLQRLGTGTLCDVQNNLLEGGMETLEISLTFSFNLKQEENEALLLVHHFG